MSLSLQRYAELRADVDAGNDVVAVLAGAGLTRDQWQQEQQNWLDMLGDEVRRDRFELNRLYQEAYTARQPALLGIAPQAETPKARAIAPPTALQARASAPVAAPVAAKRAAALDHDPLNMTMGPSDVAGLALPFRNKPVSSALAETDSRGAPDSITADTGDVLEETGDTLGITEAGELSPLSALPFRSAAPPAPAPSPTPPAARESHSALPFRPSAAPATPAAIPAPAPPAPRPTPSQPAIPAPSSPARRPSAPSWPELAAAPPPPPPPAPPPAVAPPPNANTTGEMPKLVDSFLPFRAAANEAPAPVADAIAAEAEGMLGKTAGIDDSTAVQMAAVQAARAALAKEVAARASSAPAAAPDDDPNNATFVMGDIDVRDFFFKAKAGAPPPAVPPPRRPPPAVPPPRRPPPPRRSGPAASDELQRFARICAELAHNPARRASVLMRHNLDEPSFRALSQGWWQRLNTDRALEAQYHAMHDGILSQLRAAPKR